LSTIRTSCWITAGFKKLQLKYTAKAEVSFDQIAADELNYSVVFNGHLMICRRPINLFRKGKPLSLPAIIDEGDTVGVRIFDTGRKLRCSISGLNAFVSAALRKECTYIIKNMPQSQRRN